MTSMGVILCAWVLVGFTGKPEGIRANIELLGERPQDVTLLDIKSDGVVSYELRGTIRETPLEDVTRITPQLPSTEPAAQDAPGRCLFSLIGGEKIAGKLLERPGPRVLRLDAGLGEPLDIPMDQIAGIRFSDQAGPEIQSQFESRLADRPPDKDLLFVIQGEKAVVVTGAFEGAGPAGWEFTVGKRTQKQPLDAAYAVVLGGPARQRAADGVVVRLLGDCELPGKIASASDKEIALDCGPLGRHRIPWTRVFSVQLRSSRIAYVSDLPIAAAKTSSILNIDFPPQMDRAVSGEPLRLRGDTFEKGLGVHAKTSLSFKIGGQFEKFIASVGIDDAVAPGGSAVFRVLGDGKLLHETTTLRGDQPAVAIGVDVKAVRELTLECDDAGDADIADHGDWAGAMLIKARTAPVR